MDDRLTRTSKFLSYVLRHNPDELGLTLEPGGWVDIDTLIEQARARERSLSRARLRHVIDAGEKQRFALSDDGSKIRANYGHSVEVDLNRTPTPPPDHLFHGTAESTLPLIRAEGLQPQSRQYVHLSSTREEARAVGARHGAPVVLVVAARSLHEDEHTLYQTSDGVWLTAQVPPSYLREPVE